MPEIIWYKKAEKVYFKTLKFWKLHNKSNSYSLKIILNVEKMEKLLASDPFIGRLTGYEDVRLINASNIFHWFTKCTTVKFIS